MKQFVIITICAVSLSGCASVSEGWHEERNALPGERVIGSIIRGDPQQGGHFRNFQTKWKHGPRGPKTWGMTSKPRWSPQ